MSAEYGPSRVPGVRRTNPPVGPGAPLTGARGSDGGQEGSGAAVPPQRHAGVAWTDEENAALASLRFGAHEHARQAGGRLSELVADRLADMTRQRDEAVKAFQRERARIGRLEAELGEVDEWTPYDSRDTGETFLAESVRDLVTDLRAALADRPTDAP